MAADTRHKNGDWKLASPITWEHVPIALLMDIRDELRAIRSLANCYRIPRALDAMHEMGVELRRKKRALAKRRRSKK